MLIIVWLVLRSRKNHGAQIHCSLNAACCPGAQQSACVPHMHDECCSLHCTGRAGGWAPPAYRLQCGRPPIPLDMHYGYVLQGECDGCKEPTELDPKTQNLVRNYRVIEVLCVRSTTVQIEQGRYRRIHYSMTHATSACAYKNPVSQGWDRFYQ